MVHLQGKQQTRLKRSDKFTSEQTKENKNALINNTNVIGSEHKITHW